MRTFSITLAISCMLFAAPVWGQGLPCSQCGPGPHWIDGCAAGPDQIADNGAVVGIDLNLDCSVDVNLILNVPCGLLNVNRSAPLDDSANFPGLRPIDGHNDVIDTEIISMCLSDGNVTLVAGLGQGGIVQPSLGAIAEDVGDNLIGESFFDVFFEVDLGGGQFAYNHTPLLLQVDIDCVPPQAQYFHPTGCLPLFNNPVPGMGVQIGNLVTAQHLVNSPTIPTLSEWGLIVVALLAVLFGAWYVVRRRRDNLEAA